MRLLRRLLARPRLLALLALMALTALAAAAVYRQEVRLRAAAADLERFHPTLAREQLSGCVGVWPWGYRHSLLSARAARLAGDLDEAERCLNVSHGKDEEVLLEWSMLHAQEGDLTPTESFLKSKVDAGHPLSPFIMEALTQGYLRTYRFLEAMGVLKRWFKFQPESPQAYYLRGRAWQRVHNYPSAAEDYRRAVELEPDRDEARLRLVDCLLEIGANEEVVAHLAVLRARRPDDPDSALRLCVALNNLADQTGAEALARELVEKHPAFAAGLTVRGQLELQADRSAEAEAWLRKALALSPNDRQANFLLYRSLEDQGRTEAAQVQKGRVKEIEEAITRILDIGNRQMAQRPHDPSLHYQLGSTMMRMGYEEVGLRWLYSALQEDSRYGPAHAALADYFDQKQEPDRAAYHRRLVP